MRVKANENLLLIINYCVIGLDGKPTWDMSIDQGDSHEKYQQFEWFPTFL